MFIFKKKKMVPTNLKLSDYLPIGTIIKLYNDDNLYMIYRYMGNTCIAIKQSDNSFEKSTFYAKEKAKENIYYAVDYAICSYEVSEMDTAITYYIKHEDIKEVIYQGYSDLYRENILKDLDEWNEE